jgi:hypothetical protein
MSDQAEPEVINMSVDSGAGEDKKGAHPSNGGDGGGVASDLPPDGGEPLLWRGDLIRVSERYVLVVQ